MVASIAFFFPRFTMVLLVLFSDYLGQAYDTVLWPLLGFFFVPYTTLAYAFAMHGAGSLEGFYLVVFAIGLLMDFSVLGGGGASAKGRKTRRRRTRD